MKEKSKHFFFLILKKVFYLPDSLIFNYLYL